MSKIKRYNIKDYSTKKSRILIYNLAMDENSPALKFTQDWVDEFAEYFENVVVYATHVGKYKNKSNVSVIELGGGNLISRLRALIRILLSLPRIFSRRHQTVAFHHMSTITTVFPGLILKIFGIRQGLWYSHSFSDKYLHLGAYLMDAIFSPHRESFPLKNRRLPLYFSGHGIDKSFAQEYEKQMHSKGEIRILSVGRIARIKKLETLLDLCARLPREVKSRIVINLVGPSNDEDYLRELKELSSQTSLNVLFIGTLKTPELIDFYERSHFYFMGTPNSVDKAALEAGFFGCIPLSTNSALQELTGLASILKDERNILESLTSQLDHYLRLEEREYRAISEMLCNTTRVRNQLSGLISFIVRILSVQDN
jgi:glycosyltransferase involved in cell wall biosynthesis